MFLRMATLDILYIVYSIYTLYLIPIHNRIVHHINIIYIPTSYPYAEAEFIITLFPKGMSHVYYMNFEFPLFYYD